MTIRELYTRHTVHRMTPGREGWVARTRARRGVAHGRESWLHMLRICGLIILNDTLSLIIPQEGVLLSLGGYACARPAPCVKRTYGLIVITKSQTDYSVMPIDWYRLLCGNRKISLSLTPQSLKQGRLVNLDPQNDGPKTKKWHQIVTVRRRAARGADDQRSSNMVNKG